MPKAYINDTQFEQICNILEMLGTRDNKEVAKNVIEIFDNLIDELIAA